MVDQHQRSGRRHQARQRQDQGQTGGDQGSEGEHEDRQGDRPGDHLRPEHGAEIGLVEVRPEHRGSGGVDLDAVMGESLEGPLEIVGRTHHRVGVGGRASHEDRRRAVRAERDAGHGWCHRGDARVGLEQPGRLRDRGSSGPLGDRSVLGVDDHLDRVAGVAAEVLLDDVAHGDRLRPVRLPAGTRQLRLDSGRERTEADDDQHPHQRGHAPVRRDGDADPAEPPSGRGGHDQGRGGMSVELAHLRLTCFCGRAASGFESNPPGG
ncbi:unannotated protein [freshwater metagenome]|uniref:Unannotated protein n=1 Tax=freshwater metagenome TaxID=449393 RepID=A0A6J6SC42_9ZZZZ